MPESQKEEFGTWCLCTIKPPPDREQLSFLPKFLGRRGGGIQNRMFLPRQPGYMGWLAKQCANAVRDFYLGALPLPTSHFCGVIPGLSAFSNWDILVLLSSFSFHYVLTTASRQSRLTGYSINIKKHKIGLQIKNNHARKVEDLKKSRDDIAETFGELLDQGTRSFVLWYMCMCVCFSSCLFSDQCVLCVCAWVSVCAPMRVCACVCEWVHAHVCVCV